MQLDIDPRDRESVVRDLRSSDEEVRRLAVERVGLLPPEESLPLLVAALGDPSWRVRKTVVERLVDHADTDALAAALIGALADGDNPGRRNSAVEALVACGSRVVPSLVAASSSDDVDVRKFVVDALAGIGDPEAGACVLGLLDDPDANVRAAAADALGALHAPGCTEALLTRAVDPAEDPTVRFSCLRSLGVLEESLRARDLTPALEDPILKAAALDLLRRDDDDEAVDVLLKGMAAGARSVREAAIRSLLRLIGSSDAERAARLGERVRDAADAEPTVGEAAVERLAEADLPMRLVLVQFLGLLRDRRAVVPILRASRDEALAPVVLETLASLGNLAEDVLDAAWAELDADLRREACALHGRTSGEAGAARLLLSLEDPEAQVRIAAARALGERRHPQAVSPLVRHLTQAAAEADFEAEEEIRALSDALIAIADREAGVAGVTGRAVELLRASLEGAPESVRLEITRVLGWIGRHEDSQLVAFLLKDPSPRVRRAAVEALARLEPGTAAEPLRLALADEEGSVRIAAAYALAVSQNDDVMDDLLRLAEDAEPHVRAAAVRALGARFGSSPSDARRGAALEVLDRALADDPLVALGAVGALSDLGGEAALRVRGVLTRGEPELVKEAVACIARHGDVETLEGIVPLVSHPDWSVRAEAIEALAERGVLRAAPAILRRLEAERDPFVRDVILRALQSLEV